MQLPLLVDGEWPFIDREFIVVLADHSATIGRPNKEVVVEDRGTIGGEFQMEIAS